MKKTNKRIRKKYTYENMVVDFPDDFICNRKYKIIVVNTKRKTVPCFHVIDTKTMGYEFDSKISLTECRYLRNTQDILNRKQLNELFEFLQKPNYFLEEFKKSMYWQFCKLYNLGNISRVDENQEIPNYRNLKVRN